MPVPFNIELKQDDAQRVIELNGVPTRFYASAQEFNIITSTIAYLLGGENQLYKGEFDYIQEIEAAFPLPEPGSTASLKVVDGDDIHVRWDNTSKKWVKDGFVKDNQPAVISMAENIRAVLEASGTKYYGTKNGVPGVYDLPAMGGGSSSPTYLQSFTAGWQSGLTYQPYASWYYNGVAYSDTSTLTAVADETHDRLILFVVDLPTGQVQLLQGEPSENPEEPPFDPVTQLKGPLAIIKANATEPDGVTGQTIFAEGAPGEWTFSEFAGPKFYFTSPINPHSGNICVETIEPLDESQSLIINAPQPVPAEGLELQYWLKNKTGGAHRWLIRGTKTNGDNASVWLDAPANYDPASTAWQMLTLVVPASQISHITDVRLISGFDGFSYFLDDIRLVGGTDSVGDIQYATQKWVLEQLSQISGGGITAAQLEAAKQEAITESKAYADSLVIGGGDNVHDSYDTMAEMIAAQADQVDGEYFVVIDASAHSTVDAGWAFFEYLGTNLGTEEDYRKLSEEESLDLVFDYETRIAELEAKVAANEAKIAELEAGTGGGTGGGFVTIDFPAHITGAVDGTNKVFQTSGTFSAGKVLLFLNGVGQELGGDYTESTNQIIEFIEAPHVGDKIMAIY
jgi:hypothetical protein